MQERVNQGLKMSELCTASALSGTPGLSARLVCHERVILRALQ